MARTLVYQQIYDRLLGKYGWDAIWADNTEPQSYPEGVNVRAANTALGKGALYINAYPLQHNKAVYEGWRKVGPNNKRVYILTRSAFAGPAALRGGVLVGRHQRDPERLRRADPRRASASPSPGCRTGPPTSAATSGHSDASELFTRWFQFGAFCPMFRIHGQARQGAVRHAVERARARPTCSPSTICAIA